MYKVGTKLICMRGDFWDKNKPASYTPSVGDEVTVSAYKSRCGHKQFITLKEFPSYVSGSIINVHTFDFAYFRPVESKFLDGKLLHFIHNLNLN